MFQFPSNGKLHSNSLGWHARSICANDTMFQFPSNGKLHSNLSTAKSLPRSFNSLQTGNCIQTHAYATMLHGYREQFQFPSNGKLHSNLLARHLCHTVRIHQFQFPSNGKLHSNDSNPDPSSRCRSIFVSIPFKRETAFKRLESRSELPM